MAKKEVRFDLFCKTCEHLTNKESEDPCDECLNNFYNEDSHRPVRWKEKENIGNSKPTTKGRIRRLFKRRSQ